MRTIKIDPFNETVTEVTLPDSHDLDAIYSQIGHGCDTFTTVSLSPRDDMFVDDEGLLKLKVDEFDLERDDVSRFFVLTDPYGAPLALITGCGLVMAHDEKGETVGTRLPLALFKNCVRFIDKSHTVRVGEIANRLAGVGGVCTTQAELRALQSQQAALVAEAFKFSKAPIK